MKKKVLILGIIIILIIMILGNLIVKKETKEYVYYTFDGNKGISDYCTNENLVECKINGKMVEVSQYSENNKRSGE